MLQNGGRCGILGAANVRRRLLKTAVACGNDAQSAVRNAKPGRRPTMRHGRDDSAFEGGGIALLRRTVRCGVEIVKQALASD